MPLPNETMQSPFVGKHAVVLVADKTFDGPAVIVVAVGGNISIIPWGETTLRTIPVPAGVYPCAVSAFDIDLTTATGVSAIW